MLDVTYLSTITPPRPSLVSPRPTGQTPENASPHPARHPLDLVAVGVRRGDDDAFRELHRLTARRLESAAFRVLRDAGEAEDCVQQAFLELVCSTSRPGDGRALEAWLHTSVRFTSLDALRRRGRRPEVRVKDMPDGQSEDRYDLGLDSEMASALADLTEQQRQIIHLKHVEGLDGHQIAATLGASRSAVYAAAARSERRLRAKLNRRVRTSYS